jgi:hypothetical protein
MKSYPWTESRGRRGAGTERVDQTRLSNRPRTRPGVELGMPGVHLLGMTAEDVEREWPTVIAVACTGVSDC